MNPKVALQTPCCVRTKMPRIFTIVPAAALIHYAIVKFWIDDSAPFLRGLWNRQAWVNPLRCLIILNAGVFLKSLTLRNSASGRINENVGNKKAIPWTLATPIFSYRRTDSNLTTAGSNCYVFPWTQPRAENLTCKFFLKQTAYEITWLAPAAPKPDLYSYTSRESGFSSIRMSSP